MDTLRDTLKHVMAGYAKTGLNGYTFLTANADETQFVVTGIGHIRGERVVNTALVAQLKGDMIIIERDSTDKPLVHALLDAGISRKQIILAYKGEPVPEGA
ncbi:MAG: XisI protein [Anaerolineae bacterium]|nr:XisI protein [Anaerolineae bacterium]